MYRFVFRFVTRVLKFFKKFALVNKPFTFSCVHAYFRTIWTSFLSSKPWFYHLKGLFIYRHNMSTYGKVKGLVTLIAGGASGLGKACAEHLLNLGSKVIILDLPTSNGKQVAEALHETDIAFHAGDITSEKDVEEALNLCRSRFGKLNVLVNCAAIGVALSVYNITEKRPHPLDPFEKLVKVNVIGNFNLVRQSIGLMLERKVNENEERGIIIQVSSTAAFDGQQGQLAYAASSGALNSMTLPLARDCARFGIRAVTIAPGNCFTPLTSMYPEKVQKFFQRLTPYPPRMGEPSEFAHLVQCVIENPMINGEVIRIDGGLRLPP
ncbi:oxidoreductase, short chain dehydrogenase/reductase family protein [Trichuris suis]|nr:oxidoreductase, short chain dehydrogenase/reductase family protein [Trichuris suis]